MWGGIFQCCRFVFTFTSMHFAFSSYNAIKAYKKEGKLESLSASEHLVSAAEAGEFECKEDSCFASSFSICCSFVCPFSYRWQVSMFQPKYNHLLSLNKLIIPKMNREITFQFCSGLAVAKITFWSCFHCVQTSSIFSTLFGTVSVCLYAP